MKIWKFIKEEIEKKHACVLITVVEKNGSGPGIVGFKMAVSTSGNLMGSIGGGVMEYNMVELAKKKAKKEFQNPFIKKQIHDPDAGENKSGLICSGEQTQAFVYLEHSMLPVINQICSVLEKGDNGALSIDNSEMRFDPNQTIKKPVLSYKDENTWEYKEQIGIKPTLYIFGAGHVSLPLSEIFRAIDFNVYVFDNRDGVSTFTNNTFAHKKEIINFEDSANYVPEGDDVYAVIMTVGHKSDELVLKKLIPKKIKYLGMIGSKSKTKKIFDSLISQGIQEADLARVDAPIGLPIKSKTTSEIAISIAAKVIEVKNS